MQLCNSLTSFDKLDLSNATLDSIYEDACDYYGVKILSPDFLTATFASRADCADIDWYAYFDEQREIRQIIRMTSNQENNVEVPTTKTDVSPLLPSKVSAQTPPQEPSADELNSQNLMSSPRLMSHPTQTEPVSQKSIMSEEWQPPHSPKSQSFCGSVSPTCKLSTSPEPSPIPDGGHGLPTPNLEHHERLQIPILNGSVDPVRDVCMSGALHPADVHPALTQINSIKSHRLASMLVRDDAIVCSSDPTKQVINMPDRLISREEFVETWANKFFIEPDTAIRWLPYYFYTTNAGIVAAEEMSNRQLEKLVRARTRKLKQELGMREDEELPEDLLKEMSPSNEDRDWCRAQALAHFAGEFDYTDGRWVKYPENLIEYPGRLNGVQWGRRNGLVWKFWAELWEKGKEFWDNVCVIPTVEKGKQD
ncbi:hypothetical protein H2198_000055 [Neophaeococcomyces mojaviensis]|uniref:Uncharacterized protein n=1 Tax=Neophaeococcomyces mojaviensis TaxID=3383035 RepID=A0ACC3AL93_9EURO|nr:hypothetical protein H2198_000055 [Knufia sp. JES_112]